MIDTSWKQEVCGHCNKADWLPEDKVSGDNEGFCRALPPAVVVLGLKAPRLASLPPVPMVSSRYRPISKDMPACALFHLENEEPSADG